MLQFSIHRFLCTIVRQSHASACGTALRTGACRAIVVSSRLQSFASRGPLSASLSSPSDPAAAPSTVPAPEVAKIVFVAGISFSGSTLTEMGVAKVNPDGSTAWSVLLPGGTTAGMVLGSHQQLYLAGGLYTARIDRTPGGMMFMHGFEP